MSTPSHAPGDGLRGHARGPLTWGRLGVPWQIKIRETEVGSVCGSPGKGKQEVRSGPRTSPGRGITDEAQDLSADE